MKNQEKPASFIGKLYNILKSKQHCKAIIWDSELKGIRIVNQKKLEQTVLPRYYRHNRFASFVRQLNMYDFHKIHLGDHKSIFCHDTFDPKEYFFIQNSKQTIYVVKRKVTFNLENSSEQKDASKVDQQKINDEQMQERINSNSIRSLRSLKSLIPSEKQNIWSQRSSFKLVKNSLRLLNDKKSQKFDQIQTVTQDEALEELLQQILPLNLNADETKKKIRKLQKTSLYKRFLKNQNFKITLYQRLGIQFDENEKLSQLSIEDQLLIQTRKTLTQRSLKWLQSGPINYRDTLGQLMNL